MLARSSKSAPELVAATISHTMQQPSTFEPSGPYLVDWSR